MEVKVALVTGGGSGIGAATAALLSRAGVKVYAASRRAQEGGDDTPDGVVPVRMDVNDAEGTREVVRRILDREGRLDAVVCNAGNGIYGAVEETSDEEARAQLETNFFGAAKTLRACLDAFRQQGGRGRIVVVSSMMALVPLPFQGYYAASKAALVALCETLSMELRGTHIQCCCILPGDVATGFTGARRKVEAAWDANGSATSRHAERLERNLAKIERDEQGGMSPEAIARVILAQLRRRRMASRVVPGLSYKVVALLVRILPARWRLRVVNALY